MTCQYQGIERYSAKRPADVPVFCGRFGYSTGAIPYRFALNVVPSKLALHACSRFGMSTTPISIRLLLYSGSPGDVAIPDAAAVIFALQPSVATPISALVQVETNWGKAKGQTIIGTTLEQRIPMIASEEELNTLADRAFSDPTFNFAAEIGAILARQPDNANVVLEMGRQAARLLERDLRR